MMKASELERMLREFGGPLSGLEVRPHPLAQHLVRISWVCQIHGLPHFGEADYLDLGVFSDTADVIRLAGLILKSLEEAEKKPANFH